MNPRPKLLIKLTVTSSIIAIIGVFLFNSSHKEVFPNLDDINYFYGSYHEDVERNWSTVAVDSSKQKFIMHYELSKESRTPFVAGFIAKKGGVISLANIHKHNTLKININSRFGMRIPIMLTFDYQEGEAKPNGKPFPMVSLIKYIDYTDSGDYNIPISDMRIPDWWYRVHRLHQDEVDLTKLTNMKGIIVGSCSILRDKVEDTIQVNKVEFFTNNNPIYQWVFIFAFSIVFLTLAIGNRKKI